MEEYKPNSHKSKEAEKRIEKVVSGTVKAKKRSGIQKLTDVFISEDADNVRSYILMDILVPAVKKAISDVVTNGIDMILYGDANRSSRTAKASKVSYGGYYERERRRDHETDRRNGYEYDEIVLETRGEAEDVLARMEELIEVYGSASVADLYDLVGVTGRYTDNKYGWTSLRSASVARTREGYLLKLPRALPLD